MYKLSGTSNSNYLTYFNETTVKRGSNTYYIPAKQSLTVTLTIATATESTASTTK